MKKREAALQEMERAEQPTTPQPGTAPVVVEAGAAGRTAPNTGTYPTTTTPVPPSAGRRRNPVDIVTSSYVVADKNKALWRFSWKVSVRNQERTPVRVRVEMDFRDITGALITAGDQTINIAGSTVTEVTGVVAMKATDAMLVTRATPRLALLASP